MSKAVKLYWFSLDLGKTGYHYYLTQARDIEKARKTFGSLGEGKEVIQLTWLKLHKITGCIIPDVCKAENFACCGLYFRRGKHYFTIWSEPIIED